MKYFEVKSTSKIFFEGDTVKDTPKDTVNKISASFTAL